MKPYPITLRKNSLAVCDWEGWDDALLKNSGMSRYSLGYLRHNSDDYPMTLFGLEPHEIDLKEGIFLNFSEDMLARDFSINMSFTSPLAEYRRAFECAADSGRLWSVRVLSGRSGSLFFTFSFEDDVGLIEFRLRYI